MAKEAPKTAPVEKPAEPVAEPARKGPLIKIAIIAAIVLVQIVGSYFLQKNLFFASSTPESAHATHVEEEAEGHGDGHGESQKDSVQIVMMDEIVVNPANTGGRRYLATVIGLQSSASAAEMEIGERTILIRDAVITLLSSKNLGELSSTTYRDTLKFEIRDIVNQQLKSAKVDNVVFSEYVLQ